jgi:hypothetical protein
MSVTVVRYTTTPEAAEDNATLVGSYAFPLGELPLGLSGEQG